MTYQKGPILPSREKVPENNISSIRPEASNRESIVHSE